MRALVIHGSPRKSSFTAALAGAVGAALDATGMEVCFVELAACPPTGRDPYERLRQAVADADAVVLATPVHHCGYSGLLKTALDALPSGALVDRAVGLLAQGAGPYNGNVVCEQLRTVVKALGGWAVPTQVSGGWADFTLPDGGAPTPSAQLLHRCRVLAGELHRCAAMLEGSYERLGAHRPAE
ncbi:NADPH-dependent FMN reductase [Streptomyces sp. NPDC005728]|uniref:NADPH-dependent FMN reductase n=1 Tax=Streptomyces sp. NPDC005728 TaxID=3157054 RepID=UPI0033D74EA1